MLRATESWMWIDLIIRRKQWKRDMRFGTWNLKREDRLGSLKTVVRELAKYELDLVGMQKVWWDKGELLDNRISP
jgi:hypothetical protein